MWSVEHHLKVFAVHCWSGNSLVTYSVNSHWGPPVCQSCAHRTDTVEEMMSLKSSTLKPRWLEGSPWRGGLKAAPPQWCGCQGPSLPATPAFPPVKRCLFWILFTGHCCARHHSGPWEYSHGHSSTQLPALVDCILVGEVDKQIHKTHNMSDIKCSDGKWSLEGELGVLGCW